MANPLQVLDAKIAAAKSRVARLEALREEITGDPELSAIFEANATPAAPLPFHPATAAAPLAPVIPTPQSIRQSRQNATINALFLPPKISGGPTAEKYFNKIATFLESQGNQEHSVKVIAREVGEEPAALVNVIYRTHGILFEGVVDPTHKGKKKWRLLPQWREVLKQHTQGNSENTG